MVCFGDIICCNYSEIRDEINFLCMYVCLYSNVCVHFQPHSQGFSPPRVGGPVPGLSAVKSSGNEVGTLCNQRLQCVLYGTYNDFEEHYNIYVKHSNESNSFGINDHEY